MVLLAILSGVVAVMAWRRHVSWTSAIILMSWGLLAAGTTLGRVPAEWLNGISATVQHWM